MRIHLLLLASLLALPACSLFGGGGEILGGTYEGTSTRSAPVSIVVPAGTETGDEDISVTLLADGTSFSGTGTYDDPTLRMSFGSAGTVTCTVADGGDTLECRFPNGSATLTR
ncbi:MAG: hypothetical protein Rubg2KO_27040 [Rubricoccaceae bacterium]